MKSITTEDLKATCQNYPQDAKALACAQELERRVGPNDYSLKVYRLCTAEYKGMWYEDYK
jgi:hypothetical protein